MNSLKEIVQNDEETQREKLGILKRDIQHDLNELILAQDGLRGLSFCLTAPINDDHVERMGFVIGSLANQIQRVTNELEDRFQDLTTQLDI